MSIEKEKEKEKEKLREEFRKLLNEEEKMLMKMRKEVTNEKYRNRKDFVRRLELERREALLNGVVLKAQEVSTLQQNQLEQEEKLAAELDILKRQGIVEQKMRQHIRENSHELKELESQLKAAYIKKAIAAQLAEKEAYKLEDQIREKRAREVLEKAMGTLQEQEEIERLNEQKQKEKFRHLLQDQIIEKERMRQQEFISYMNEKKINDEILQTIKEEEVRALEEKRCMQQTIQREMEQFYKAREMWKATERLKIQEEEEKRKQINEEKARAVTTSDHLKKMKEESYQKIIGRLTQEANEKRRKAAEYEELMSTLMWNEKEEIEKKKVEAELAKEQARKVEARETFKQLLAAKARKEREEKELDAEFARLMKEKIEEEERMDREKQEQRRATLISNRKYNEEAMRRNVRKRAEDLKLTQLINELQEKEEKRKEELVEEERLRMLKEHAPKLMGYFPKGCLREKDLEALGLTGNSPLPNSSLSSQ